MAMFRTPSSNRSAEAGFTLAGLIVIMTIIAVTIAYTVPRQWSIATARDRDQQTLFAMKQYARAIQAFQDKNKAQPVTLDQLKQARNPRFLRGKGELIDPLTGKVDWIPIPMTNQVAQQGQQPPGTNVPGIIPNQRNQIVPVMAPIAPLPQQQQTSTAGQPGGLVGPMMGVRPNKTGTSYLKVNGNDTYEQWSYTTADLQAEIAQRRNAIMIK
jgi:type II secretory pathway pseudopilin PulG